MPDCFPAGFRFCWRLPDIVGRTAWPCQHSQHDDAVNSLVGRLRNCQRIGVAEGMAASGREGLHSVG